jgi:hypothetical protein
VEATRNNHNENFRVSPKIVRPYSRQYFNYNGIYRSNVAHGSGFSAGVSTILHTRVCEFPIIAPIMNILGFRERDSTSGNYNTFIDISPLSQKNSADWTNILTLLSIPSPFFLPNRITSSASLLGGFLISYSLYRAKPALLWGRYAFLPTPLLAGGGRRYRVDSHPIRSKAISEFGSTNDWKISIN